MEQRAIGSRNLEKEHVTRTIEQAPAQPVDPVARGRIGNLDRREVIDDATLGCDEIPQRNPLFPALRSGHRLFQRPSPQKQIPISKTVVIKIGIAILIGVENKFVANNAGKGFECSVERGLGVAGRENELHDLPVVVRVGVTGLSMNCR